MEQSLYPAPSKDLSQKRRDLAPEIFTAFQAFSQRVFCRWCVAFKDEGTHCGRCGARDPVPVLHPQPHQTRDAKGRERDRRLWKRSGLRPRCGRALPPHIPRLRSTQ